MTAGGDRFAELAEPLLATAGVTRSTMMGLPCLRREGAFFAAWDGAPGRCWSSWRRRGSTSCSPPGRAVRTGRAAVPAVRGLADAARATRGRRLRGRQDDAVERRGSATCSTSSVPRHQPSSSRGRPAISPRTSSSASTTAWPDPDSSCPARGVGWPNDDAGRSRWGISPGLSRRSDRDRRPASSASDGYAGSRTSTSSSSTTRTSAEPTVVVREPTSSPWTRRCGATSARRPGSSHDDCAAPGSSSGGRRPPRTVRARRGEPTAHIDGTSR